MATGRQNAKTRATSPKREKLVRKRKPSKPKSGNPKSAVTRLKTELREALEQQTATAEVLRVISQSPTDVQPVLKAVVAAARRFCGAEDAAITLREGSEMVMAAHAGGRITSEPKGTRTLLDRSTVRGRSIMDAATVHMPDVLALDPSEYGRAQHLAQTLGFRAIVSTPMLRDAEAIGCITLRKADPVAFTQRQVELLETFAAQAVIAIENVRLFTELRQRTYDLTESLEYQTATSEVLEVIGRSTSDLQPVLDTMLAAALRLCDVQTGGVAVRRGDSLHYIAATGHTPEFAQFLRNQAFPINRSNAGGRAVQESAVVHIPDIEAEPSYAFSEALRLGRVRTMLSVPLMRQGEPVGVITMSRGDVQPFTDRQIALVKTFADQAVIAMENARLLGEQREALEQQTATAEVLQVINSSPGDLAPVFDAMLEKAMTLCGAAFGFLTSYDAQRFTPVAMRGVPPSLAKYFTQGMDQPSPGEAHFRILQGEDVIHNPDQKDEEAYRSGLPLRRAVVDLGGARTALVVALRKDGAVLGALTIYRKEVRPFSDKQISLMRNFAAQAVIAMENARLLGETQEALERQTATIEVLETINSSPGDLQPVFGAILEKAMMLCEAAFGTFATFDGHRLDTVATRGVPEAFARYRLSNPPKSGPGTGPARLIAGENYVHDIDAADSEAYRQGDPSRRAIVELGGARTILNVALRKDDVLLGTISIYRQDVRPFSDNQIALLQGFATQAVIAMENARLLRELRERTDDLTESLEYQTATSELLEVISRSTSDVQPVLDTMLASAGRLCETSSGGVAIRQGDVFRYVASMGVSPELDGMIRSHVYGIDRSSAIGRVALSRSIAHIADAQADPTYSTPSTDAGGIRTLLGVPLLRESEVVGVIVLVRDRVHPFSERQIALIKTFADQAVIAMENARLLGELTQREEELRVTFDNMGDGVAMFDAEPRLVAWNRNFVEIIGLPDALLAERPSYADYLQMLAERGEFGTENVEAELASRLEDTDRELRLERTRADGTVIEVRRNAVPGGGFVLIYSDVTEQRRAEAAIAAARDAAEEALEQQTATAEILQAISQSPTDVQPVLDAVVKAAVRFCGTTDAVIILREGDGAVYAAHEGPIVVVLGTGLPLNRQTAGGRAMLDSQTCHLPDIASLDPVEFATAHQLAAAHGFRAALSAPLRRQNTAIGAVTLRKAEAGPFTPRQIELLETFAAQAVIAIENVRLFTELSESLEQQTATADVLKVIASSPTDVQPVLDAVVKAAQRFCGAADAIISLREGDEFIRAAHEGSMPFVLGRTALDRSSVSGRAIVDGRTTHVPDIAGLHAEDFATSQALAVGSGARAALGAPMLREGIAIGSILLRKTNTGPFAPKQIELLEAFAAQAVIAIENVRLFTELRGSLERLKAAQANLIQSEKMASLGQLTAGIAHEIKNPLNFVNNFSGLSVELLDELKEVAAPVLAGMNEGARAEFAETVELLTSNLAKIAEHGRRADGIVKSMLSHSRGGTGDWQESNINALVEEALNLAYHGARAQDQDFNVTLERDFASEPKSIEVVPQDVTRVFLNLFGNGFYATRKRHLGRADAGYRPTLRVSTRDLGDAVEVRVRDNGTGILPEVRAKLFQPFFTTKPTGEGTGLGLSISYDIVTQQHGGTIEVESEPGSFTEFTVRLPRRRRAA